MKETKNQTCQIHVMPSKITDADLAALFNGIISVVKKKFELDSKSELFNMSNSIENLSQQLKSKTAECSRLKNEILSLKAEIAKLKNQFKAEKNTISL